MAKSDLTVNVLKDKVINTSISTNADGFNSARVVSKIDYKQYLVVNYEWEASPDSKLPDFVMDLMLFMQANELKVNATISGKEEAYAEYMSRGLESNK